MKICLEKSPWVGYASNTNTLKITETPYKVRCGTTSSTSLFLFLGGLCFGPGLSAYLYLNPSFLRRESFLAKAVIYGVILIGWWLFFKGIIGSRYFEIERGSGDIRLYRRRGKTPFAIIHPDSIEDFEYHDDASITTHSANGTPHSVYNRTLTLVTRDGTRIPFCVSPDFDLIERIRQEIEENARLKKRE